MGFAPIVKPGIKRHDELEDLIGDPILAPGSQFLAGTLAARPAPSRPGRFYFATDDGPSGRLYRDTGAAWQEIVERQAAIGTFIGAKVWKVAGQTISDITHTVLSFDSETFDSGGFHDNVTNNNRLTVPANQGGLYVAAAGIRFANNALGYRRLRMRKNGGGAFVSTLVPSVTAEVTELSVATILQLSAGDYVESVCYQNSGGNLEAAGGDDGVTWMICYRLGATS